MSADQLLSLKVRNFQSLREIDVDFGPFTVFVGPSSSGKSAILRSIRAVVRNVSTPNAVSHGASSFEIEAKFADCTVALERGKAKSSYRLDAETFTKAGVSVPDAVRRSLRMPLAGGFELSLADQFDRPFLLAEPGAAAAKVLGELTNAALLMDAAREANRRRQSHAKVVSLRAADVESIRERLADSARLKDEREKLAVVRRWVEQARDLEGEVDRLASSVEIVEVAQKVAEQVSQQAREVPDVRPLLDRADALQSEIRTVEGLLSAMMRHSEAEYGMLNAARDAQVEAESLRAQEKELLRRLGRCPSCGQPVSEA